MTISLSAYTKNSHLMQIYECGAKSNKLMMAVFLLYQMSFEKKNCLKKLRTSFAPYVI